MKTLAIPLLALAAAAAGFGLGHATETHAAPGSWADRPTVRAAHEAAVARQLMAAPEAVAKPGPGVQNGVVPGVLDGAWFKLNVSAKGYRVDNFSGEVKKASWKDVVYMQLQAAPPDGGSGTLLYQYITWVEPEPGLWTPGYGDNFFVDGVDGSLTVANFMGFDIGDGNAVASIHDGRMNIKLDKEGQLKSASWKTLAGTLVESTIVSPNQGGGGGADGLALDALWGSMKISGKTVPVDKLPFNPEI